MWQVKESLQTHASLRGATAARHLYTLQHPMEKNVVLRFPFSVEGAEQECSIAATAERKENIVSISLPFDLCLSTRLGSLKLKKQHGTSLIYVFSFPGLSEAKAFIEDPVLCVEEELEVNCSALEEEMNQFMEEYERCERKIEKRVKVYDEEGFYEYM